MKDKSQDSEEKNTEKQILEGKEYSKNWLCCWLGHSPECECCDPERETQPLLGRKIRRYQIVE